MAYPSHETLTYCATAFTDSTYNSSSRSSSDISTTSTTTLAWHEQRRFEACYSNRHALLIRKELGEAAYQLELLRLEACALWKHKTRRMRQYKWLSVQIDCEQERRSVVKGWMRLKAVVEILYLMGGE